MKDPEGGLWDLQSTGTIGTNFFNYALIFNCTVSEDGIHIEAHYDGQILQAWLVERLLLQFEYLVERLNSADTLAQTLDNLEQLNSTDKRVIASWNSRPVNVIDQCIHTAIHQAQCILRPNAQAIEAWDIGTVTYQELDEFSNRLASKLVLVGVKPGTFVPICFDKSGWTIIAMLAIMKAGAA